MLENNKALARRYFDDLWTGGNLAIVDEILAPDIELHGPGMSVHGAESVKQFVFSLRTAFPDLRFTEVEYVAEADRVASSFAMRGTHLGDFRGIPPTGQEIVILGVHFFRVAGGRVSDILVNTDTLGLLQQLGVLPQPGDEIPPPIR